MKLLFVLNAKALWTTTFLGGFLLGISLSGWAQETITSAVTKPAADGSVLNLSTVNPAGLSTRFASVEKAPDGLLLKYENSPKWPSVDFEPPSGMLDLSGYAHVEVNLTNMGNQNVWTSVMLVNPGHVGGKINKSIGNHAVIAPGESTTITVDLDEPGGKNEHKLNPAEVDYVRIFVGKVSASSQLKLTAIRAVRKSEQPSRPEAPSSYQ